MDHSVFGMGMVLGIVFTITSILKVDEFVVRGYLHFGACVLVLGFGLTLLHISTRDLLEKHLSEFWKTMLHEGTFLVVLIAFGMKLDSVAAPWMIPMLTFVSLWPLANIIIAIRKHR